MKKVILFLSILFFISQFFSCSNYERLNNGSFFVKAKREELYTKYDIRIISKDSCVRSFFSGDIIKIDSIANNKYMLLRNDSLLVLYSDLKNFYNVKINDSILSGQKLGYSYYSNSEKMYGFTLMVSINQKQLHYLNLKELLKGDSLSRNLTFDNHFSNF